MIDVQLAALQLPIPRIAQLSQMICTGKRKDGLLCGNTLAFLLVADGMLVEIVCDKCNARGYAGDREQWRRLTWLTCQCGTRLAKAVITNDGILQIKCRSCGLTMQAERKQKRATNGVHR